eukprot:Phypoly_transcript_01391.p2 GENE.Phypoly_transcript_01391~~Phypoly_transcript_01391.p2  ORF type:complete len:487 (-),score=54.98 Phypoly_transcript_01391:1822-3282(-)
MNTILCFIVSPFLFAFWWIGLRLLYCVYNYQVCKNKLYKLPAIRDPFARLRSYLGVDFSSELWRENTELAGKGNAFLPVVFMGPYMDMGQPIVMVNSPDLIREISDDQVFPKLRAMYEPATAVIGDGLVTGYGAKWKRMRSVLNPLFYHNKMRQFAQHMTTNADELISILRMADGKEVPCMDILGEATLSVFVDCIFSRKDFDPKWTANHLRKSGANLMLFAVTEFLFGSTINSFFPWSRLVKNTKKTMDDKIAALCERARKFPVSEGEATFVEYLVSLKENGKQILSDEEIANETMTFLFAGYDTTKSAIGWTLYFLCLHRHELEKVQNEVDSVLNGRTATYDDIINLPKMKNAITEGQRLRPAAPGMDRTTLRDTELGGYLIPKGTSIYMNWHAAHTDPTLWDNPEQYYPDRFNDNTGYSKNFFAFSYGPRNCIGQKFAICEAIIVTATLLHQFDIQMGSNKVHPTIVVSQDPVGFSCKFIQRR